MFKYTPSLSKISNKLRQTHSKEFIKSGGPKAGVSMTRLRTKTLMRDLGTRLECRQRVFVRTGKTLWK